jgi:hypothetical protein
MINQRRLWLLIPIFFCLVIISILSISLSSAQTIQPILRYEFESIEGGTPAYNVTHDTCYQESANESNQVGTDEDCGLNYSGIYNIDKEIFYINYTKPTNSVGASWRIKYTSANTDTLNIPESCYDYNANNIELRINATVIPGGLIPDYVVSAQCYNSSWIEIFNYSVDDITFHEPSSKHFVFDGIWNTFYNGSTYNLVFYDGSNYVWSASYGDLILGVSEEAIIWNKTWIETIPAVQGDTIIDTMGNYNGTLNLPSIFSLRNGISNNGLYSSEGGGQITIANNLYSGNNPLLYQTEWTITNWARMNGTGFLNTNTLSYYDENEEMDLDLLGLNKQIYYQNTSTISYYIPGFDYCESSAFNNTDFIFYSVMFNGTAPAGNKVRMFSNGQELSVTCNEGNPDYSSFENVGNLKIIYYDPATIDEFRIYNKTLTDAQIMRLYTNPGGDITEPSSCPKINCKDKKNRNNPMCMNYNNSKPFVQLCKGGEF